MRTVNDERARTTTAEARGLGRVERRSLSDEVLHAIQAGIISGKLRQGDRLVESLLAADLGVSRAPVREALQRLEQQGVVVPQTGRGISIRQWSAREIEELYDLRGLLEARCAYLAAPVMTDEEIGVLADLVAQMWKAAAADDRQWLTDLDMEFHTSMCAASHHSALLRILPGVHAQIRICISVLKTYDLYPDPREIAADNEVVLNAIRTRDPETARLAVHRHISAAGERLYRHLRNEEARTAPQARLESRLLDPVAGQESLVVGQDRVYLQPH